MQRILGLLMCLWALTAAAEVSVWQRDELRNFEQEPPGMECEDLRTRPQEDQPLGEIEDLPKDGLLAGLLCPECLRDPRYAVDVPLRRIERILIPPPSPVWGEFDCDEGCPRWLLRQGEDALLIVHVGAQIVCGVTGNCPGRVYERSQGRWSLIAEFNSNEGIELCVARRRGGLWELWLTTVDEHPSTVTINWKPQTPQSSKKQGK